MNNHYLRYQNDVNNTASNIVTQMVCAEKGLDYNQVFQMAQQAHVNGIFQQEQMRQFNKMINRHYNGDTLIGKIKDAFTGGSSFPMMMGMPQMPMSPTPAFMPQVSGPMSPQQVAGMLTQVTQQPTVNQQQNQQQNQQLAQDVEDLKQLVSNLVNAISQPQQTQQTQTQTQQQNPANMPIY